MSTLKGHLQQIRKVNPRLSDKECMLIHEFMNDMSDTLQMLNSRHFNLTMFKGVMEEHFPGYAYGTSTIVDHKTPQESLDAVLISFGNIEFNVFLDSAIKVIVFRAENPYKHIFEISVSKYGPD